MQQTILPIILIVVNLILIALQLPDIKSGNAGTKKSAKTILLLSTLGVLCGIAALLRK